MLTINADDLKALAPRQSGMRAARQHEIIEGIGDSMSTILDDYAINTPLRIAHFLAQLAHESDGFCTTEEYASGQAYEGRRDLGNVKPGDGPLFKGRGLIQITGRANYASIGAKLTLDLVDNPLKVNQAPIYLLVSCVFWQQRNINRYADADDIISVTHLVNGGLNGLESRKAYLVTAKAIIAARQAGTAVPPTGGVAVMHRGSTGDAVGLLQRDLASLGYPVALDADFGAATEIAVKHFQAAAGLEPDGIVGAVTWDKLQASLEKPKAAA